MRPKRAPAVAISRAFETSNRWTRIALPLLIVAALLGGGHIHGPVRNGIVEALALTVLLHIAWVQTRYDVLPDSARGPLLLFAGILLLFLAQLVPLPPLAISGREATDAVTALAGVPRRWRPLSLDPAATSRMAISLAVPLATALLTILAGQRGRILIVRAIALLAGVSAMFGMVQLGLGFPDWASPFGKADPGIADGLFVNRNHQAMFLLCGLIATGLWIRLEASGSDSPFRIAIGRSRVHAAWLLMPLLALMILAAASKAGIGLLAVILPLSVALALPSIKRRGAGSPPGWIVPVAAVVAIGLVVAITLPGETVTTIRSRLIFRGDARLEVLPDLLVLLRQYWPWGSGAGTFVPAYMGIEDLDKLGSFYLNHAHDEYIEWLIETGLPGLLVLLSGIALIAARLWSVLSSRRSDARKALAVSGGTMILILGLHSAIDYPLRTDSLAALFGVALGLVFAPGLDDAAVSERGAGRPAIKRRLAIAGVALFVTLLGGQIMRLRLAEVAAGDANASLAAAIGSNDGMAEAYVAEAYLASGQPELARDQALAAIDHTPLAIVAVRTLAMAEARLGHHAAARDAWRAAAGLGWRDVPTQYWAMKQALADGENAIAGMRADAVLRLNEGTGPFADLTRKALVDPALRSALKPRLAMRPAWRESFFHAGRILTAEEVAGLQPMLLELQRGAAPPSALESRDTMLFLLNHGRTAEAVALDAPFASRRKLDPGSLLSDGGFNLPATAYSEAASPFEWSVGVVGGANAVLESEPSGQMVVSADGSSGNIPLVRWVALAPGRYTLSFRMKGPPDSPTAVGVRAICPMTGLTLGKSGRNMLAGDGYQTRSFDFVVPADCSAVLIGVGAVGGGPENEADFDDIRLVPETSPLHSLAGR